MSDLQELTSELMQDSEFVREYEAIQPEVNITRAILDARINAGMTQMELSKKSGISQADISRLEKGTRNPSLNLLKSKCLTLKKLKMKLMKYLPR